MKVYPIRFEPIYRDYLWGGDRIVKKYHRDMPEGRYAESWEVCDRKDASSIVANGPYKGLTLSQLLFEWQEKLIGLKGQPRFPLLIKILDPKQTLSIQVHPGEKAAKHMNTEAKNEAWYVLEAEKSYVYAGFKYGVHPDIFKMAVEEKRVAELLRKIRIKIGDVINVPGGRVHSICEGALLFEVQQNSDTTYRIYDWDRLDDRGKLRDLHLIQAMQVIDFADEQQSKVASNLLYEDERATLVRLLKTPYFLMEKIIIRKKWIYDSNQRSFQIYFCLKGSAMIRSDECSEVMKEGETYLVPAYAKEIEIVAKSAICEVLKVTLP